MRVVTDGNNKKCISSAERYFYLFNGKVFMGKSILLCEPKNELCENIFSRSIYGQRDNIVST